MFFRRFTLPCKDAAMAEQLVSWLKISPAHSALEVDIQDDRRMVDLWVDRIGVPWEVASAAVAFEYADETEVCDAVIAFSEKRGRAT